MNSETISIITPVYNMAKYLKTCIDSILNQTYREFQLILIDDGSTDGSGKICDDYAMKDSRIVVIHTPNCGQDAARNTALEHVKTDYILMIDADDCVNCRFIDILFEAMKKTNADIVFSKQFNFLNDNEIDINEGIELPENYITVLNQKQSMERLCRDYRGTFVMPQKLYKRKVFDGVKYPPVRVNIDEWVIHHLLVNSDLIAEVDAKLYYYRLSPEGMTRSFSLKKISGVGAIADRINTCEINGYGYLIDELNISFINKMIAYYNLYIENKLDGRALITGYKKQYKKAVKKTVLRRNDLYSKKQKIVIWIFGYSTTLFRILKKLAKVSSLT